MTDNTLTIALEGDVSLGQFAETISHFNGLVEALSKEVAVGAEIDWIMDDLHGDSPLATVVGIAQEETAVQHVIDAFTQIGQALQRHEPIPFHQEIANEAIALTKVIGSNVTEVRFMTAETDSVIYGVFDENLQGAVAPRISFGSVKGKVQAITSRGRLKFTLYDHVSDRPVTCYLQPGNEEKMRDIWGKDVIVTGQIVRGGGDSYPRSVRHITELEILPEIKPGSYKEARGILNWVEGDEPAEVSVRRIRDAEG